MTSQLLVALGTITDGRNGTDTPEVNTCFDFYALPAAGVQRLCVELSSHLVGVESTSEIILLTRHISFFSKTRYRPPITARQPPVDQVPTLQPKLVESSSTELRQAINP